MSKTTQVCATVYFDGGCPVCSREIAMYQRQAGADSVRWVDVTGCSDSDLGPGLTRDTALARLHVRNANGHLVSGAKAFTTLWRALPQWAWLGRLLGTPVTLWLLEAGYRSFLRVRRFWRHT